MTTRLSDLAFVPQTFAEYVQQDLMKRSRFFESGAVVANDLVFPRYGNTVTVPAWDGLDGEAEVIGNTALTLNKLDSSDQVAPVLQRGKLYGHDDLVASFTASDPMGALASKIATFWQREYDRALVNCMIGAANGIDSANPGDVVFNGGTNNIDLDMVFDARALFGEYQREGLLIVLNSKDFSTFQKADAVDLIPGSQVGVISTINDMPVIISDTLSNGIAALVRPGAFFYANGTDPRHVLEEDRDIAAGVNTYSTRARFVIHPVGAKWVGTPAGATATNAELATATNWQVAEDKLRFGVRLISHSN